jgi:hypothetical protein
MACFPSRARVRRATALISGLLSEAGLHFRAGVAVSHALTLALDDAFRRVRVGTPKLSPKGTP